MANNVVKHNNGGNLYNTAENCATLITIKTLVMNYIFSRII